MIKNTKLLAATSILLAFVSISCQVKSDTVADQTKETQNEAIDSSAFLLDEDSSSTNSTDFLQKAERVSCGYHYLLNRQKASNSSHELLKVDHSVPDSTLKSEHNRNLQSGFTYGPMSILFDYRRVDKMLETSRPLFFAKYFIIKKNLQKVANYISAYFKVLKLGKKSLPTFKCLGYDLEAAVYEEDLKITVFSEYNLAATYYAAATACASSTFTQQPVAGIFLFNIPYMGITIQEDFQHLGLFFTNFSTYSDFRSLFLTDFQSQIRMVGLGLVPHIWGHLHLMASNFQQRISLMHLQLPGLTLDAQLWQQFHSKIQGPPEHRAVITIKHSSAPRS